MGFGKQNHTEGRQDMAQLNITLDEATLKDLMRWLCLKQLIYHE